MLYNRFPAQTTASLSADVVIMGSGPSAFALASALLKEKRRILVIEARNELTSQGWTEAAFGPFAPEDFRPRTVVKQPGWEIFNKDLSPFYSAVDNLCLNGTRKIPPKALEQSLFKQSKSLHPVTERLVLPKASLADLWRKWATQTNCDLILGAEALDLSPSKLGENRRTLRTWIGGKIIPVEAKYFICAAEGLENARLLFHSGSRSPALGAYLMEQPSFYIEDVLLFGASRFTRLSPWATTAECQKREKILSATFRFIRPDDASRLTAFSDGLLRANQYLRLPALCYGHEDTRGAILQIRIAQTAREFNRVRLKPNSKDRFGRPELQIEWRMTEEDWLNVEKSLAVFNSELIALSSGRYRKRRRVSKIEDHLQDLKFSSHQMGTTRMSSSPENGVVDLNLKSYDFPSVYVAGPSVFPSSSSATPTYTALALALRLAKHLNQEMGD